MEQLLSTKLYIPRSRPKLVTRPRLIQQLNEGLQASHTSGVTLISAPAGFGKTTLLSEWVANCERPVAWLSLDEGDSDPARFLAYLVTALQTVEANIGKGILVALESPQPPPIESILTSLLNEITTIPDRFILVLDDYHVVDSKLVDKALTFLFEHQPSQVHLVIATREDPGLPLARLRALGQLTELRAADLRFTLSEATEFLNQAMGLKLSAENVAALETRTEGWIAGLQLAALSMQGHRDTAGFIQSFTGSHRFVMDYLVEEVLQRQPENLQVFLLHTSILDRLCGPLCDAVLLDASVSGQATLEYLERANLFIVPLDNERHWYRYHHLFADLLRQRLYKGMPSSTGNAEGRVNELHIRASQWYEDHGLDLEAFHHAAAANDLGRAARLVEEKGLPLHSSSAMAPVLKWLASLPANVLESRPSLWVTHAALLLATGQTAGVEEKLRAAEVALAPVMQEPILDEKLQFLVGQIAAVRSTLALTRYDVEGMLSQSQRALEYLPPGHAVVRCTALWTMGFACYLQRDFARAKRAYLEAISISQASGAIFTVILATIGLGNVQEAENQLHPAAETYRHILQLVGDQPQQIIHDVHLGLARILYEWNELESAERHGEQALQLARRYESFIDRFVICELFLARLKLAQGDVDSASALLAKTEQSVRQQKFVHRIPEVVDAQVLVLLRQGNLAVATQLVQAHELPIGRARVHLAQGDPSAALAVLKDWRQQVESTGWENERLKTMVLQAIAHRANGEIDKAMQTLGEVLALAEPAGFIRTFVDAGLPMDSLLSEAAAQGILPNYVGKLRAAFEAERQKSIQSLIEPLSQRELEVLQLIAQGLSNDEIGKRLFLALDTIKGHNRRIYDKLQVQRRTEAVARARELGLL